MITFHLPPYKQLIRERCGLVFEDHGESKLQQSLNQRASALQISNDNHLLHLLASDAKEFQNLVHLLTVNETYFFREPAQIQLLVNHLVPRLLSNRFNSRRFVRILSAGCSSGEEPYSIAMALHDVYGTVVSQMFHIKGADLDSEVLKKARRARYQEYSFRGIPSEFKQRYFVQHNQEYLLNEDIQKLVTFETMNLINQPVSETWDIILFRNVSIYFDTETRKAVLNNLASIMAPEGYLLVGSSETMSNDLGVLTMKHENNQFYFCKHTPDVSPKAVTQMVQTNVTPLNSFEKNASQILPSFLATEERILQWIRNKEYSLAEQALQRRLSEQPSEEMSLVLLSFLHLQHKNFDSAQNLAMQVLQFSHWNADALMLLGWVAKWCNQPENAIAWFKKVIYTHHTCWPAHYYLAEEYQKCHQNDLAVRAYGTVQKLISDKTIANTGIRYLPIDLSVETIRYLCNHKLQQLTNAPQEPATSLSAKSLNKA